MAASRSKAAPIGSAQWVLEERQHSQDLVAQELEDFGFSVRNELEWLNEHMTEIFAQNGQNSLDVFKTPGKLRGKTPRTTRKKNPMEVRQPLGDIFDANKQSRASPALQSLRTNLQKPTPRAKFQVAGDAEKVSPIRPITLKSPAPLFTKQRLEAKPLRESPFHPETHDAEDSLPSSRDGPEAVILPMPSTQDTVSDTQDDMQIFSQGTFQSTQHTAATQSFRRSMQHYEEETGESFVSAKDFASKDALHAKWDENYQNDEVHADDEDLPVAQDDAHAAVVPEEASPIHAPSNAIHPEIPQSPEQQRVFSEDYSISAETHEALDTANVRAHAAELKNFAYVALDEQVPSDPAGQIDETILHHDVEEVEDDVRSPSDDSSPVKPLVRKSSLTFASLPAREPLVPKKSMGNRVSRTSHVDQSQMRYSQAARYTGGKSLGGSQYIQMHETQDDEMDVDEDRPMIQREESETTKKHNAASTKTLKERLNMLNQRTEPPKRISQNIVAQPLLNTATQPSQTFQVSQLAYPVLPPNEPEMDDDDEDSWISPMRPTAPAPPPARPTLSTNHSADSRPASDDAPLPKESPPSDPDFAMESTTPAGSPTLNKKYMDGPLSASKAKFYSALRAAKDKIIGSSASSAQVKMDALAEGPVRSNSVRSKLQTTTSTDDIFNATPKRVEKAETSIFSHFRSPSKESVKSKESVRLAKAPKAAIVPNNSSSSPRDDGRRTRSSSERERQKDNDIREKETKQQQRAEERLKEMREKEQSKAAAHYQKAKIAAKTPAPVPAQATVKPGAASTFKTPVAASQAAVSRPGTMRMNTEARQADPESADEMPPPPPPKSLLPTGTAHKLREPKRLVKPNSKETLPRGKPQKIQVNLHRDRFGQAAPAPKAAPAPAPKMAPPASSRQTQMAPKAAPMPIAKPGPVSRLTSTAPKPAPRIGRTQPMRPPEKPKPAPAQSRPDLAAARPISRMQTVQDAARINVPPVNPAKPPVKRPFQAESEESLHRPAKRPSQQARSKPATPAHAQFAQGKIPFAESTSSSQTAASLHTSEDIKLPDIMTDSEDEDSDNDFEQPSWVATPNLRSMLEQQQLLDPEQIFGPIAPLNMEQVFPNKERHKRFRERTSSAYWTNDQVTEEERRKEREARERLVREGAWTYNPSPRPQGGYKP